LGLSDRLVLLRWLLPEGTASAQPFDTTIVQRLQNFGTFSRTKKVCQLLAMSACMSLADMFPVSLDKLDICMPPNCRG